VDYRLRLELTLEQHDASTVAGLLAAHKCRSRWEIRSDGRYAVTVEQEGEQPLENILDAVCSSRN